MPEWIDVGIEFVKFAVARIAAGVGISLVVLLASEGLWCFLDPVDAGLWFPWCVVLAVVWLEFLDKRKRDCREK